MPKIISLSTKIVTAIEVLLATKELLIFVLVARASKEHQRPKYAVECIQECRVGR